MKELVTYDVIMTSVQFQDLSSGYFQNSKESQYLIYHLFYEACLMIYPIIPYNVTYFCPPEQ
jgi:hypothetical protein